MVGKTTAAVAATKTAEEAPTSYVTAANGTRFAYRIIAGGDGSGAGVPLVMNIHFRGNMDFWDPWLVNRLAEQRPVIIFDQAGIGRSTGEVPTTFQGWADDMLRFTEAIGLKRFDLLGFSMGGMAAQMAALTAPTQVRKLILAGTSAAAPTAEKVEGIVWPRDTAPQEPVMLLFNAAAANEAEAQSALTVACFNDDEEGRTEAAAYFKRLATRSAERADLTLASPGVAANQGAAVQTWNEPGATPNFGRLSELKMPVLVLNGDNDVLVPSSRSWELYTQLSDAQLIMYPRSGHGFIWQHARQVAADINTFLNLA